MGLWWYIFSFTGLQITHTESVIKYFCRYLQDADTDENQGSLGFEEFCSFYKMISTRRDLYLIMISYSNQKEVMDLHDLARFLENEQKVQQQQKFMPIFHVIQNDPHILCIYFKVIAQKFSNQAPLFVLTFCKYIFL